MVAGVAKAAMAGGVVTVAFTVVETLSQPVESFKLYK